MDKKFIDGLRFNLPSEKAPDYVKGSISIKVSEFVAFAEKNQNNNGYLNIDLKVGKSGKAYAELNAWTPRNSPKTAPNPKDNTKVEESHDDIDEIPF